MKKNAIALILTFLWCSIAFSGQITTFASGDTLSPTSLNANFQHIHSLMVGGHGGRLLDGDVSGSAAIAHSKMATPEVLPKAFATITALCGAGVCAETALVQKGVSAIQHVAVGEWTVTWATPRADANYAVHLTPRGLGPATGVFPVCFVLTGTTAGIPTSATVAAIGCWDSAGASPKIDVAWNLTLMDNT